MSFLTWKSDASISSTSSMSATILSPFQIHPRTLHNRKFSDKICALNWCSQYWSFEEIGWYSTIGGRIPWSVTGICEIYIFIRWEITIWINDQENRVEQSLPKPDCDSTGNVPFTLRTAFSAIPSVSERCGIDVQWLQDNSAWDLPNS